MSLQMIFVNWTRIYVLVFEISSLTQNKLVMSWNLIFTALPPFLTKKASKIRIIIMIIMINLKKLFRLNLFPVRSILGTKDFYELSQLILPNRSQYHSQHLLLWFFFIFTLIPLLWSTFWRVASLLELRFLILKEKNLRALIRAVKSWILVENNIAYLAYFFTLQWSVNIQWGHIGGMMLNNTLVYAAR